MSASPIVSVVIPTHNRASMVGRAIRSVLCQTFEELELLVVDDASMDNTWKIVKGFQDLRMCYLCHDVQKGAQAARNTGLRASRGKYIAFLDSDDEWLPDKLSAQMALFTENPHQLPDLGVVVTGFVSVDDSTGEVISESVGKSRGYINEEFIKFNTGGNHTFLALKSSVEEVGGFDESLPAINQWDIGFRLSTQHQFDIVERNLAIVHKHAGPHIYVPDNIAKAYLLLLRKYEVEFKRNPCMAVKLRSYLATYYLRRGDKGKALRQILRLISVYPQGLKPYGYLLSALLPSRVYSSLARWKRSATFRV